MAGEPSPQSDIRDAKARLRAQALALRDALAPNARAAAAEAIALRAFPVSVGPGAVVSGFLPIRTEINPLPLMKRLRAAGAALALPVVAGPGRPLIMRLWRPGEKLAPGPFGLRQPAPEAPATLPDVVIAPLAAFDRAGRRLGYGAGYYDMTLHELRARKTVVAVGIAFAAQEVARVPATERDARLDLVLTERDVIDCRGA